MNSQLVATIVVEIHMPYETDAELDMRADQVDELWMRDTVRLAAQTKLDELDVEGAFVVVKEGGDVDF